MPTVFVKVLSKSGRKIAFLTEDDGLLDLTALQEFFLTAITLSLLVDGIAHCLRTDGVRIYPTGDWDLDRFYDVVTNSRTSRHRSSSYGDSDTSLTSCSTTYTLTKEKERGLREWLYICSEGGEDHNVDVCVSVISSKYCASASHCFPNAIIGDVFTIRNLNCDPKNQEHLKLVEVLYVERPDGGRGADLIVFGSSTHDELFQSAPATRLLPCVGTRYIAMGLGPYRDGDNDGVTVTYGHIATNIVDKGHHMLGDSGNNAGYSGGIVISRKGRNLLGIVTKRTAISSSVDALLKMSFGEVLSELIDRPQPRTFILASSYIEAIMGRLDEHEDIMREQEAHDRRVEAEQRKKLTKEYEDD